MTSNVPKRHPWGKKSPSVGDLTSQECYACGEPAITSILLAHAPHGGEHERQPERLYLPNQAVRTTPNIEDLISEYWFCHPCIRFIEDTMRAAILYLQAEARTVDVRAG